MDREKIIEALNDYFQINKDCYAYNLTRVKEGFAVGTVTLDDFEEFDEQVTADIADHLIANGIGDITAEKHRADRAEEALDLAYEEWTCCDACMFSVDCKTNRTDCKKAEISKIKQLAEARLKELNKEVE